MEKQANSINPKEREKMQKEFDEVAHEHRSSGESNVR